MNITLTHKRRYKWYSIAGCYLSKVNYHFYCGYASGAL